MIPGYFGERPVPYRSPIYVTRFRPLKTGKSIVRMAFHNAIYAEGVQGFQLDMRILKRGKDYLVSELLYGDTFDEVRCAVISDIQFGWVERFCPELLVQCPADRHEIRGYRKYQLLSQRNLLRLTGLGSLNKADKNLQT